MGRLVAAVLVLALAAATAGCESTEAQSVLEKTDANLDDITSGELRLRMVATAGPGSEDRPVGFELQGPFALATRKGELPVARLRLTRLTGRAQEQTTFISTGQRAYVEVDGTAYELPDAQVDQLRAKEGGKVGGLEALDLVGWARDPVMTEAGQVDGVPAQRLTSEVDVVKALNDVVSFAADVGAGQDTGIRKVEGEDAEHLRRAVRQSHLEVVTGKPDRLLRRLRLDIGLAAPDVQRLEAALGPLAAARLAVEVDVSDPNRKVTVDAPPRPRPLSELQGRR